MPVLLLAQQVAADCFVCVLQLVLILSGGLCSCSGGKLGLSMRDVDQATGRDLLDLDKIRAAQVSWCWWRRPCPCGCGHAVSSTMPGCCLALSTVHVVAHAICLPPLYSDDCAQLVCCLPCPLPCRALRDLAVVLHHRVPCKASVASRWTPSTLKKQPRGVAVGAHSCLLPLQLCSDSCTGMEQCVCVLCCTAYLLACTAHK